MRTKALATCLIAVILLSGCGQKRTKTPALTAPQRNAAEALRLVEQGDIAAAAGRTERAEAVYLEALNLDNRSFAAWNNLGELLLRQERYADAVQAFKNAGDLTPTDPRPPYNAGLAYQKIGWADDARTHFLRALERDPNYLPALRGAVRAAESLNISDAKALDAIRRALLRETDDQWRAYFERQRFRVEAGLRRQSRGG